MGSELNATIVADGAFIRTQALWRADGFMLAGGETLGALEIAYWTMGELNAARSNAILLCHGASGHRDWPLPFCRPDGAFDPRRWFLVSVDLPGGGGSSRARDGTFPVDYEIADLANALAAFLPGIGLASVRALCGPSMAGMVGLDLAIRHPHLVGALALWQGGYRCDGYAKAVAGLITAILALDAGPLGMKAAARAFLPSLVDRAFLAPMDDAAREEMIERMAREWSETWAPDELAARYAAMARCDLAAQQGGDEQLAARIGCGLLALTTAGDAIFPPGDWTRLAGLMPHARMESIRSPWGHMASAAPPGSAELQFFETRTAAFLNGLAR